MRKAIILHGMPSKEEYFEMKGQSQARQHWLPWLQRQYQSQGIPCELPELPVPYAPVYEAWKETFEQFDIDEETDLVGHSCGGGFLVRWLSEHKDIKVGNVALVAPWLDPNGTLASGFFTFEMDKNFPHRTKGVDIFVSTDDDEEILESVDMFLGLDMNVVDIHTFRDKGHFCFDDMHTDEFPELRDALLSRQS